MSYDIVGDIAIIKQPVDDVEKVKNKILEKHKFIKTILLQLTDVKPPYRIPEYKIIYGNNTETIHVEYGLKFKVDLLKSYYSPRLSNERYRISKLVKYGEEVLVMFAGVNVYPIYIAKFSKAKIIYSIELNPYSVKYGLENLKLNKINNVITVLGDVRVASKYLNYANNGDAFLENISLEDLINSGLEINNAFYYEWKDEYDKIRYKNKIKINFNEYEKKFDRIIMPLPKEAGDFLDVAINLIKNNGIIHLYQFYEDGKFYESAKELLDNYSSKFGFDYEILNIVKAGDIGPGKYRVCIDFKVFLK